MNIRRARAHATALILAAGSGDRLGSSRPKAFHSVAGRPLLARAAAAAAACPEVGALVIAVPSGREDEAKSLLSAIEIPMTVVTGGFDRQESVRSALAAVHGRVRHVICHDAARPFATPALFSATVRALRGAEGAVPVIRIADTVKRVRAGFVTGTIPREELGLAQTPQAFVARELRRAHDRAEAEEERFTDDAALMEWAGYRVRVIPGETHNFKITTVEDLARAELVAAELDRQGNGAGEGATFGAGRR
jgi:2-C-methyl-D-erythritol 4-phosphate cytidylyltransferase